MTEGEYITLMRYFSFVNLVKPSVNRLVSGVYSKVSRQVEVGSPYKEQVDDFLLPANGYALKCREWFKAGVLFGTGVLSFTIRNNEVLPWLPNPINTEIICNPFDASDIEAIVEKIGSDENEQYRIVDKNFWSIADKHGNIISAMPHGLGIVPAVLCYGESQLQFGSVRGKSLVESGVQFSAVLSRLLLNMVELVKTFSDPKLSVSGPILNQNKSEVMERGAVVELEQGGSLTWASPQTNFQDLSDTIDGYMKKYAISAGIPLDALDPTVIPDNTSATGAALRFGGLSDTVKRLTEEQKIAEIQALTIVGALYQFINTQQPVTFSDFKRRFRAAVTLVPSNVAGTLTEEVTAWQQLVAMKAKTHEDLIRHFNPEISEQEIQRRLQETSADSQALSMPQDATDASQTDFSPSDSGDNTQPKGDPTA